MLEARIPVLTGKHPCGLQWNSATVCGQVSDMASGAVDDESDADLIHRSLTEPGIFAVLFDRHAVRVHRFLAARTNSGDVEDLVSETFGMPSPVGITLTSRTPAHCHGSSASRTMSCDITDARRAADTRGLSTPTT